MKQFISKNAMALVALAIAAGSYGLMSFGESVNNTSDWYPVDANGSISPSPMLTPPGNSPTDACSTVKQVNTCALQIELDPNLPFPETVEDARTDHLVVNEAFSDYE